MNTIQPAALRFSFAPNSTPRRGAARLALLFGLAFLGCGLPMLSQAIEPSEIPLDAPADEIMATPEETQRLLDWASLAFAAQHRPGHQPAVQVEVRRQDHNSLRFGQSCMETPIRIGSRSFGHGLGTHANSEILLRVPAGARSFRASVGIDNNFDTQGQRGSVVFSVEAGGQERFRSSVLRGTNQAMDIQVDLPPDSTEIVLKADTTSDGPAHDQADWADARVVLNDGREIWADQDRHEFIERTLPFSFVYGGAVSDTLLPGWQHQVEFQEQPNRWIQTATWLDPRSHLSVKAITTVFKRYAAAEWMLCLENTGTEGDTPLIECLQAIDTKLRTGYFNKPVVLHTLLGDQCNEKSFLPVDYTVSPGKATDLVPSGGRSSNGAFPFFNLQYGDEGLLTAIGWSGQWAAHLERSAAGPTRLQAGLEKLRLRLHPGEQIRTPRVLVMPWKGDRWVAHNRFRRLLLFEYVPRIAGRPLALPLAMQCFDRYSWSRPDWATEAGQVRAASSTHAAGCDTHWLDAAWFEGGFPDGVGNWYCKPREFPRGLKPVSDACHTQNLKFLVWFEPERVAANTRIAREHPEFVYGGAKGGLFKLGDPAARRYLTDQLSQLITENGIDVYRNDFNIDPLSFWQRADEPDRVGMNEVRYTEGHYAMWDELRSRHPGLWIDNCASGGRRIDLESLSRSVPLWRSDTGCAPGHANWDQVQTCGLSQYIPLFTSCAWDSKAYTLRSAATGGAICQFDYLGEKFSMDEARAALAEVKANQKFYYGDFYPLTRATADLDGWIAWQLHRADLRAGIILAFRRPDCPYPSLQVNCRAVNPQSRYAVEFIDDHRVRRQQTIRGKDLIASLELRLPEKGSSLLVRYRAK